jgi:hypothetical protein
MNLSPEAILDNWEKMLGYIETYIESPRKEKLLAFYEKFANLIVDECAKKVDKVETVTETEVESDLEITEITE